MEEISVKIYIPYEWSFSLVFLEKERLVEGDPFYLKCWVNRPSLERNRRFFKQIFARSASAITSSEKSSINANRKSTMRFPMSLRQSSYVAPKSCPNFVLEVRSYIYMKKIVYWKYCSVTGGLKTRNSSGDEIANVNFLYDHIVHGLKIQ